MLLNSDNLLIDEKVFKELCKVFPVQLDDSLIGKPLEKTVDELISAFNPESFSHGFSENHYEMLFIPFMVGILYLKRENSQVITNKLIYEIQDVDKLRDLYINCKMYLKATNDSSLSNLINKQIKLLTKEIFMRLKAIKISTRQNANKSVKRVVIVSGFLMPKETNTHIKFLKNLGSMFLEDGEDFELFLAVTGDKTGITIFGNSLVAKKTGFYEESWQNFTKCKGHTYQSVGVNSSPNKILDFAEWINQIKPDVAIIHGSGSEPTFSGQLLYNKLPTFYYPSNVLNVPSFSVGRVIARTDYMFNKLIGHYKKVSIPHLNKPEIIKAKLPIKKEFTQQKPRIKTIETSNENKLRFVLCIGRNLISEFFNKLSESQLLLLDRFISKHNNVNVYFIGEKNCNKSFRNNTIITNAIANNRIICLEHMSSEELTSFYIDSDVVFSLPGLTGGGGAIRKGIELGCAASVSYDSDAANFCDENYIIDNFEGLLIKLSDLAENTQHISANALKCYKKIDEYSSSAYKKQFIKHFIGK